MLFRSMVQADPQVSSQFAQVMVFYRGPDTEIDITATYPADVVSNLLANPAGKFKQTILQNQNFGIPSPDYISSGYQTQRESGQIIFQSIMLAPEQMLPLRAAMFADTISNEIIPEMATDLNYFTEEEYSNVKRRMEDSKIWETETASGFLSNLRFWWTATDTNYYLTYDDKMASTKPAQVSTFVETYLVDKPALVVVLVNPEIYEAQKNEFDAMGYEVVTEANAYWWGENK